MPVVPFTALPDDARLWIFAADRPLDDGERERLFAEVDRFLVDWRAHGDPLTAARDWRYDRFLLIGVDERAAGVSGCSIDALVGGMRTLERELEVSLVDHGPVLFREGDEIRRATRAEFAALAAAGTVHPQTPVFDNTVATVGQLRDGGWEVLAEEAWHARAFF